MATTFSNEPRRIRKPQLTVTTSTALTEEYSGYDINCATDALTHTLPAITANNIGMEFTFRNTAADGAAILDISPAATDAVFGSIPNAAADSVAGGVVDKDWTNTKATANKGDYCTLRAVAVGAWYVVAGVGIWASEA